MLCTHAKSRKKDCVPQLLFLAEIVPTCIFGRILPKTLFTAKNIEPTMNATSSRMPTAKSGIGCQKKVWHFGCQNKSLARSMPKIKISMIVTDILFCNMLHVLTQQTPPHSKKYSQHHITHNSSQNQYHHCGPPQQSTGEKLTGPPYMNY